MKASKTMSFPASSGDYDQLLRALLFSKRGTRSTGKSAWIALAVLIAGRALAQSPPTAADTAAARFEIADVHVTPKDLATTRMQANAPRNGRYEFHSASVIDLIGTAYGFDAGKILGGPSWLEMNRFDVIAKVPAGTMAEASPGSAPGALPDTLKEMLQSLLADRFKLLIRKETRPLPGYALTVGTKLQMKQADASGDTGCRYLAPTDPGDTNIRYACRGMSMDAFAALWPRLRGTPSDAVVNKTELKGLWNFDMKWPMTVASQVTGDPVGPVEAIDKQLGLKLEPQKIPTPVMVVESASEKPSPNLPGVAEALPMAPEPTAFDVATIKPTDPNYTGPSAFNSLPGGLWVGRGLSLSRLLVRAFSPSYIQMNEDLVVGIPGWAQTARFDITGKSPPGASATAHSGPMVRSLLEDRLGLKSHSEERPVSVYVLVAEKPKMKNADPASRTHCLRANPPAGSPLASLSLSCQNITMEQFADFIRNWAPGPGSPVLDSTGIKGGWDFTLTFVLTPVAAANAGAEPAQAASAAPLASDPNGGLTIIEAMERQLGLKLETQKRPMTVTVIDHVEQMPRDN
jgi:uncharacterized protein (TIGR03435 family)